MKILQKKRLIFQNIPTNGTITINLLEAISCLSDVKLKHNTLVSVTKYGESWGAAPPSTSNSKSFTSAWKENK